jgi:putative DNA primase/helicase
VDSERTAKDMVDGALAEKAADDWLTAFAEKSKAALAERDAKKQTEKPAAPRPDDKVLIEALARKDHTEYDRVRSELAETLGIRVGTLDDKVEAIRKKLMTADNDDSLPHWNVEPWPEEVDGDGLLDSIRRVFRRYIVLPKGADIALPLWALHAWTYDAGDVSPFLVLVSPTKRCGKTNTLIILLYLTPRSELASNITGPALFRYIEQAHPTLLIDEADSFVKDNEELRGILNSGHTKPAAYVRRTVEENGEHKTRRFSTWTPKAIATIRGLADTLDDRAVTLMLQRKPPGARVERLRKRDNQEFKGLRRQAARWAADNLAKLVDPDPPVPEILNDRAADNWRPLLAIADVAGGDWPTRAREAACTLSGDAQDSAIGVELLKDIRKAFGEDDETRSIDLVAKLVADPERPWKEWKHGRDLTQKQLGGLLRPFGITSETVSAAGFKDAKGYKRAHFEDAWDAYCPGQNTMADQQGAFEASKRRNADGSGITRGFRSVAKISGDASKNGKLSYSHAGCDGMTDQKDPDSGQGYSDQEITFVDDALDIPPFLRRCFHCNDNGAVNEVALPDRTVWLHRECEKPWLATHHKCDSR